MVIEFTVTQISLDYLTYFIKWREPNWSEKPNWPWCLGGQLSPSRVVLDYLSQKRVGQVLFRPLQNLNRPKQILLWNFFSIWPIREPRRIYQFGPNKVQCCKWLIVGPKLSRTDGSSVTIRATQGRRDWGVWKGTPVKLDL